MNVRAHAGQSDRASSWPYCGLHHSAPISADRSGLFARGTRRQSRDSILRVQSPSQRATSRARARSLLHSSAIARLACCGCASSRVTWNSMPRPGRSSDVCSKASTSGTPSRRMAGNAPISRQTARIPWVAIFRIRGCRPEVKLRRNTSASSEGIHSTLPTSGYRAPAISRAPGSLGVRDRGAPITPSLGSDPVPGTDKIGEGRRAAAGQQSFNRLLPVYQQRRISVVSGRDGLLIAEQRESLERDGYLLVPSLLDEIVLAPMRARLDELVYQTLVALDADPAQDVEEHGV